MQQQQDHQIYLPQKLKYFSSLHDALKVQMHSEYQLSHANLQEQLNSTVG